MEQTIQATSPDGNWIWNGTEWLPNTPDSGATPSTTEAPKKKRTGLKIAGGVVAGLFLLGLATGGDETTTSSTDAAQSSAAASETAPEAAPEAEAEAAPAPAPAPEAEEEVKETVSQKNARRSAESYLAFTNFSRSGLIDQLEFEGFSTADATYAVDAINPDWNEQAAQSAQDYLDISGFSRSGLIDQLEFEGFTYEQAVYGVDSVGL